jgi:hypothetical protein
MEDWRKIYMPVMGGRGSLMLKFIKCKNAQNIECPERMANAFSNIWHYVLCICNYRHKILATTTIGNIILYKEFVFLYNFSS